MDDFYNTMKKTQMSKKHYGKQQKNLRKFKFTQKKGYLKIWDNEIKEIIKKIKIAYII